MAVVCLYDLVKFLDAFFTDPMSFFICIHEITAISGVIVLEVDKRVIVFDAEI